MRHYPTLCSTTTLTQTLLQLSLSHSLTHCTKYYCTHPYPNYTHPYPTLTLTLTYLTLTALHPEFEDACTKEASITRGINIAFKMGGDFTYSNADMWYRNVDKLIDYMNKLYAQKKSRWNVFYSNPSIYVFAKNAENLTWPLKGDVTSCHVMSCHVTLLPPFPSSLPYLSCPTFLVCGFFTTTRSITSITHTINDKHNNT